MLFIPWLSGVFVQSSLTCSWLQALPKFEDNRFREFWQSRQSTSNRIPSLDVLSKKMEFR